MAYKSDIEIAQSVTPEHILNIAKKANVDQKYIEQYGNYKAKIAEMIPQRTSFIYTFPCFQESHLVLEFPAYMFLTMSMRLRQTSLHFPYVTE